MIVGEAELHLEELVVMREEVEVEHDMLIFVEHVPTPVDVQNHDNIFSFLWVEKSDGNFGLVVAAYFDDGQDLACEGVHPQGGLLVGFFVLDYQSTLTQVYDC